MGNFIPRPDHSVANLLSWTVQLRIQMTVLSAEPQGSESFAIVCKRWPEIVRIVLTGQATVEAAMRAINEGEIHRFLTKPCNGVELACTIRNALQQKDLMAEAHKMVRKLKRQNDLISELAEVYPGISEVKRDAKGAIIMDEPCGDYDALMKQICEAPEENE